MTTKYARIFTLAGAALCVGAAFADFVYPEDTIKTVPYTYFPSSSDKFRDRDNNTTNWVEGSYMVLLQETNGKRPGTTRLDSWFTVRGLRFETTRTDTYIENGGGFKIGAAGLEMAKEGAAVAMGKNGKLAGRVKLMADQVWKGPTSGSNAAFSFSDEGLTHLIYAGSTTVYNYHNDYLDADASVTSWTIQDGLTVWFCRTNALQNVDVRVVNPARIRCRTRISQSDWEQYGTEYYAGVHAKTLTLAGDAEMWQAGGTLASYRNTASTMQPLMDSITMAPTVILEDGADMKLLGAQWDIPTLRVKGAGATSSLRGSCTFIRANSAIELQDGATIELAPTNHERDVSASINVTGTGTVRIPPAVWDISGTLTLGADVDLEFSSPGSFPIPIAGGKSLALDPGAGKDLVLMEPATNATFSAIEIRSGTCTLPSMAAMPAAASFVVADGAELKFLTNDGYDASRVTLNGSGTCTFGGLVVTDVVVADSEITVNQDKVLQVYGDGLTAATRVTLAGGTMRFMRNGVTVASPVLVTDNSFIEAIPGVTGTVAGVVACTNNSAARNISIPVYYDSATTRSVSVRGLCILGPGTTVFSGGGAFNKEYGDRIMLTRGACVHLTGGVYRFNNKTTDIRFTPIHLHEIVANSQSLYGWTVDAAKLGCGWHLCVRDGGELQFDSYSTGNVEPKIAVYGPKDGSDYNTTAWHPVFEVGPGGLVTIPSNSVISLGDTDNNVYLKVTGGTLNFDAPNSYLRFGNGNATSSGEVYLESGTLSLGRSILRAYGSDASYPNGTNRITRGHFIWSGGTLKLNSHFSGGYIFDMAANCYSSRYWQMNGLLRISAQIIGENCVLDMGDMQCASATNVPPVLDQAEWYGHGTLTVKGGKELVMNSVPDGFSLKLEGEGTRVKVAEGAYAYDYDECMKHRNHKDYDFGKTYSVTNKAVAALSVASYTLAGTNCGFNVTRADLPVTVTNTTVKAGGDWNGAVALSAAGGLTAENLTFEEGALLSVPMKEGETVAMPLSGALAMPTALDVRAVPAGTAAVSGTTVFTAADGIDGTPAWNLLTGRFRRVVIEGNAVKVYPVGAMLTIR